MTLTDHRPDVDRPPGPRHHRRTIWWIAVLAAATLAVGVALIAVDADQTGDDEIGATSTTTAGDPSSTTTVPPSTAVPSSDSLALWPAPGSGRTFADPTEAARSFAEEYLRFDSPIVGAFQQGDSRSGEVEVRPVGDGPVTTVLVRQLSGEAWSVLGAGTENIQVSNPPAGEAVASPLTVRGTAHAFEGTVQVEVREDGEAGAIGAGFVTGGGDQMRPFEGSISFETPGSPNGGLVLYTTSGEDGRIWEAAALRIAFESTDADAVACGGYRSPRETPAAGEMEVKVYLHCDGSGSSRPFPAYRHVPRSPAVLRAALSALLWGPSAEERDAGVTSWFSSDTAGLLRSVTLEDGRAVVDFGDLREVIPNASTSAGSARLLEELDATALQFLSVDTVEYRIDGSCAAFSEWLQYGDCLVRSRTVSED